MLPTFVIGLREGLEAALIVGIVAAFLRTRGRPDLLRWVFVGIAAAISLCLAVGIALDIVSRDLPQRQQEGLETVIGVCAVAMVTYMVVWMRRHSRDLKGQLDRAAGTALAAGSGIALVAMAFLAVLREGLETAVFLLAAFNESGNSRAAAGGALLGILIAVALGWAIYKGGVRINLSKFFRATGVVLVLVAAGLVVNALHTAHEAGWLNVGQQETFDLSALVRPGSVQASLLTGVLGLQSHPVLIELVGWLVYLVPLGLYVAWPPGRAPRSGIVAKVALAAAAAAAVAAVVFAVAVPGDPAPRPVTRASNGVTAQVVSQSGSEAVVTTQQLTPAETSRVGGPVELHVHRVGSQAHDGVLADVFRGRVTGSAAGPATMTYTQLAAADGGRLPLGVVPPPGHPNVTVSHPSTTAVTVWVDPRAARVIDVEWRQSVSLLARLSIGPTPIGAPRTASAAMPTTDAQAAARLAQADGRALDRTNLFTGLAETSGFAAVVLALVALSYAALARRTTEPDRPGEPGGRAEQIPASELAEK